MAIELHHLHPGHDSEVTQLKQRIAELERMDAEHTLQIANMNGYISHLEEERRWRKFPDEKPSEEGYYIICGSSGFRNADKWTYCKDRQKMDFSFYSYGVKYWMPMLSAPKE